MALILHIPHSSKKIPKKYLPYFYLSKSALEYELLRMTDHYTDQLFCPSLDGLLCIKFPISRLLVDPERFEEDENEPMSAVGMGCLYSKTHDGKKLKNIESIREELLSKYYKKHHSNFSSVVTDIYKDNGEVLIIDCHSFPKLPLPYEMNQNQDRSEICIGTDDFHTPPTLRDFFVNFFEKKGFSVSINKPFSGSIVPIEYWRKEPKIRSIMIEVRRDLYMNEKTGEKSAQFDIVKNILQDALIKSEGLKG